MRLKISGTAFAVILGYYLLVNLVLYIAMMIDKKRAIQDKWRIPEKHLFLLAALGGGIGGFAGMMTQRHKTKHLSFFLIYGITTLVHLVLAYFLIKTFAFNIRF